MPRRLSPLNPADCEREPRRAGSSAGASIGATAVQLSVRELDLHGSLSAIQRLRSASCSVRQMPLSCH